MSDSDYEEDMPDLPPLPGVSDGSGLKPGSEAAAAASVHHHLAIPDHEGYQFHDHGEDHHYHDYEEGGEAKIDSVEAAIEAAGGHAGPHHHGGIPPTSPITTTGRLRSAPGQGKKLRARCAAVGCNRQVSGICFMFWFVCSL